MKQALISELLRAGKARLANVVAYHVTAKRGLFYHGTSTTLAKHILSEGFVPNPKKKIWDGETGVQQSYTGTYFTARVSTANRYADGAVKKFGGFPVVFEVQLETRTGLFDEDEIAPVAGTLLLVLYDAKDVGGLNQETARLLLNDYNRPRLNGLIEETVMRWMGTGEENFRAQPFGQLWRTRFGDAEPHPRYLEAVFKAVREAAIAFVEDVRDTGSTDGGPQYRKANTKLLKVLNLSKYGPHPEGSWTQNIRIVEPVTFRGANKILAAVSRQMDVDYAANVKVNTYWVLYGKPTKALVTDNDTRYEVHDIVKRGWPKPKQKMAAQLTG